MANEIATAVAENPLLDVGTNHSRLFVAALYDLAHLSKLQPLLAEDWGEEAFALGTRVAYLWCPNLSVGSPVMDAMGKALGKADTVTVRNWATTLKLHAMCQA